MLVFWSPFLRVSSHHFMNWSSYCLRKLFYNLYHNTVSPYVHHWVCVCESMIELLGDPWTDLVHNWGHDRDNPGGCLIYMAWSLVKGQCHGDYQGHRENRIWMCKNIDEFQRKYIFWLFRKNILFSSNLIVINENILENTYIWWQALVHIMIP